MNYSIRKITKYEKTCLDSLKETCDKYEMDRYCSIGKPSEQRVCICKRKSGWEVFMVERGIEFEKSSYKDCIEACLEVIHHCSYNKQEFDDAINEFKNILKDKKQIKMLKKCK